jgi:predicted Ser/Thr protein kinase
MNEFVGKFITLRAFPRGLMVKKLLGEGGFAFVYKVQYVCFSHAAAL